MWLEFFEKILLGSKTYELRLADGECNPETEEFTGREVTKEVSHVGKTKAFSFWSAEEIEKHRYQIISLK